MGLPSLPIGRRSPRVTAGFGALGVGMLCWGLWIFIRAGLGPGDDYLGALVGLASMALSLVPGYGLLLYRRNAQLQHHKVWLVAATLASCALLLLFLFAHGS